MSELECVIDAKAILGEGVFWSPREACIYWVDIQGCKVHRFDPATGANDARDIGQPVGTAVETEDGRLVLALKDGIYGFHFETAELEKWCDPLNGNPDNRFNDGKAGPDGRLYVGSIGNQGEEEFYRVEADRSWSVIETGITCSNGLVWSLDHSTLYYIDSPTFTVVAYDFNKENGSISNKRVIIEVAKDQGLPDGMTIDSEGMLWIAHWEGSCVRRWNPNTGEVLQEIPVPVKRVTCCAFGGEDLKDLYITTASVGLDDDGWKEQPLAGGLFKIRLDVAGVESFRFKG